MINFNGQIVDESLVKFSAENRAFKYGDGVFESLKYANGKLLFWEDHYFRLMTSMRILRMEIPMNFSPEFLEEQILKTINANQSSDDASQIRITIFREGAGKYTPETNEIGFVISTRKINSSTFNFNLEGLKIDLFKDHFKQKSSLSNLKTANALLFVLAGVFKKENKLDECILLNDSKEVVEAISANIFMVKGETIYTPSVETGCLKGVMRKNVIKLIKAEGLEIVEEAFSPFELQRADEVFVTNAINGIQWVGSYRKKEYGNTIAKRLNEVLNRAIEN